MTRPTAPTADFGSVRHLAVRFVTSLRPGGPSAGDDQWVRIVLSAEEQLLWRRMSGPDRRHAAGVARHVAAQLALEPTSAGSRPILAAALLHDVGKIDSGLGTWGRAGITAVAVVVGRQRLAPWTHQSGWRGRAGRYLTHDHLGAALLAAADSDPLTVAWAAEHHLPPARWTVNREVGEALKAADDD
ncbi:MAG: hypothetical protein M3R71_05140 [Actinomycetota bacterium]|nr:hypothetical protein [Actinomycetota bacterium]